MMRSKPATSLQKTYDECYLMCSTAVYFEGRNNEDEALRSWRSALETIYYHNAYRLPSKFTPKTETEKALQESIRQLEIQCRERVDLLQALHESRKDADAGTPGKEPFFKGKLIPKLNIASVPATLPSPTSTTPATPGWIADGTIPAVDYTDLSKPPTMPGRLPKANSDSLVNGNEAGGSSMPMSNSNSNSNSSSRAKSRGSSPDKRKPMLMTLRNSDAKKHERRKKKKATLSPRQKDMRPTASKAAGLAWESVARSPSAEKVPTEAALVSSRLTVESDSGRKEMESRSGDELARRSGRVDDNDIIPDLHWRVPDMPLRRAPAMSPPVRLPPAGSMVESQRNTPVPLPPNSPPPAPPRSPFTSLPNSPSLPPYPSYAPVSYSNNAINPPSSPKPSVKPKPAPKPASLTSSKSVTKNARGLESDPERPSLRSSLMTDAKKRQSNSTSGARIASPATKRRSSPSGDGGLNRSIDKMSISAESPSRRKPRQQPRETPPSSDQESSGHKSTDDEEDDDAYLDILNKLPKGVDTASARQVLNDIVIRGDEVHWDDVAGLDAAKKALKEAVVYPFLRPDLFSGLREPARGMLLFGPPGTGKTMLARAVATESKSTFFSVSSSTLTSKWHGESEKLVRALFGLAKALAPSIIFVDEIDSLLSARSTGSEHEASRRSKTEFLVQWSDLQRAAAGREQSGKDKKEGDASRVLVLAATNMPWDIDEAARRRFVRRQYIPLPEHYVRAQQLKNLLSHQVHELSDDDIEVLVQVTESFSGSDITALAKDAAMGPLRNLGEALLHTPIHQIRPIRFSDFEASLYSIRPSVSQDGLKEYEEWAKKFGERGG